MTPSPIKNQHTLGTDLTIRKSIIHQKLVLVCKQSDKHPFTVYTALECGHWKRIDNTLESVLKWDYWRTLVRARLHKMSYGAASITLIPRAALDQVGSQIVIATNLQGFGHQETILASRRIEEALERNQEKLLQCRKLSVSFLIPQSKKQHIYHIDSTKCFLQRFLKFVPNYVNNKIIFL